MKRFSIVLAMIFAMLLAATAHADVVSANMLDNGAFDNANRLNGWAYEGDVRWINGAAVLGSKNGSGVSSISQSFYIQPDTASLNLSFDLTFTGMDRDRFNNDTAKVVLSTLQMEGWWIFEWENWTEQVVYEWTSGNTSYTTVSFSGSILLGEFDDINPNATISFMLDQGKKGHSSNLCTTMTVDNIFIGRPGNTPTPTPEPGTMLLMGSGLAALGMCMRRRNK